jgi:hypothetical protein
MVLKRQWSGVKYCTIRLQIGIFRPIRVDHTNCLQVAIKTHSFIHQLYLNRPDPIVFFPVPVDTSVVYYFCMLTVNIYSG